MRKSIVLTTIIFISILMCLYGYDSELFFALLTFAIMLLPIAIFYYIIIKIALKTNKESSIYINRFGKKIIKPGFKPYINYTSNNLGNIQDEKENELYIKKTNPNFSLTSFKDYAYTIFLKFQKALYEKKIDQISSFSTDSLIEKYKKKITNNDFDILLNIKFVYAYLYDFVESPDGNIEKLIYQISAKGNNPTKPYEDLGKKSDYYMNTYYMEFIKKDLLKGNEINGIVSIKCSNCGSPIKNRNHDKCEHCGTKINNELLCNKWILNEFCYWNEVK